MTATGDDPAPGPDRLGVIAQYGLLAGPLLTMLDSSIVNVAVAPIAGELHTGLATVGWTVSGYLLALGVGLAGTSFLARCFGTRAVYAVSLISFTLASAGCAGAPTIELLITARVLQGLLGAPLVPLAMSMLLGGRGSARSISPAAGMLLFLAPALGPTLGGGLIALGGWRTVFLVNIPVGLVAVLAARRIPTHLTPGRAPTAPFDLRGLVLLAAGLTGVLFGASQGGTSGWASPMSWATLAGGVLLLTGYTAWAFHCPHPILDLALLRRRVPTLALLLCALASVVTFAAVFLLPVFMQSVQGHSAAATGLALLPQGIVAGLGTVLGRSLLTRTSIRTTVVAGFTILTVASLGLLAIDAHTSLAVTATILTGRAAAIGLVITPLLYAITSTLDTDQLADANSLFNILQRIAGSLGIGLIAALFTTQTHTRGPVPALHTTALLLTVITAAAALTAILLPHQRVDADPAAQPSTSAPPAPNPTTPAGCQDDLVVVQPDGQGTAEHEEDRRAKFTEYYVHWPAPGTRQRRLQPGRAASSTTPRAR